MVYVDIILSTVLIAAAITLEVTLGTAIMLENDKTVSRKIQGVCITCISIIAVLIGTIELTQTIDQDTKDRKENKTLTEYCHPYRPERIIIQKSRNSVTMPYKVKVTVLPDGGCTKVKKEIKP